MPKAKGKPLERACDACYTRRVKCSKTEPCDHCIRLKITCTYNKAKEGKKITGKRIELLRNNNGAAPTKREYDDSLAETSAAGAARYGSSNPSEMGPPGRSPGLLPAPVYSNGPQLPSMRELHPLNPMAAPPVPPGLGAPQHYSPAGSSASSQAFPLAGSPDPSRAGPGPGYPYGTPSASHPSPRSTTSPYNYRHGSLSSRYPPAPPGAPYPPPPQSMSDRQSPSTRSFGHTPGAASNSDHQVVHSPRTLQGRSEMYAPPSHRESFSRSQGRTISSSGAGENGDASMSISTSNTVSGSMAAPMSGLNAQQSTLGSNAPVQPGIFPPSFSQVMPSALNSHTNAWLAGDGNPNMPLFRLPDLDTSLADSFNAHDPSSRGQFLDWNVLMEQINNGGTGTVVNQGSNGLGPTGATANGNGLTGNMTSHNPSRRPSMSAAELFSFDLSGGAPNMFESLSAPLANFNYAGSTGSGDTPASRTSMGPGQGSGVPFDPVHSSAAAALPSIAAGMESGAATPVQGAGSAMPGAPSAPASTAAGHGHHGAHPLSDSVLIPRIATFFERLHPALPVFSRSWIFSRLDRGHQHTDEHFSSMLLAMSALVLIQPVEGKERNTIKMRMHQARQLLDECVRMRNHVLFGKNPSLESTMTSFYIFACLFGMREDNAAWFRLHEAVCVGHLLKLHEPSAYESLERDEQERRLRAYWLLAITERAYALQRGHSLGFRGHPAATTKHLRKNFKLDEFDDFPNMQLKLFDCVDEVFLDCWNGRCRGRDCKNLNVDKALRLYQSFMEDYNKEDEVSETADASKQAKQKAKQASNGDKQWKSEYERKKVQKADVNVTRQWLLNRLWLTCLSHGLISLDSTHQPLKATHAIDIARRTLRIVEKLTMPSMEAHGIGFAEKLYDIAMTLIVIYRDFPTVEEAMQSSQQDQDQATTSQGNAASSSNIYPSPAAAGAGTPETPSFGQLSDLHQKDLSRVHTILQAYVEFMQKFRSGEHPFLKQLVDAIKSLPQRQENTFESILAELGVL